MTDARQQLAELWAQALLPDEAMDDVYLYGLDPVLPSSFAICTAAQVTSAAAARAAATVWRQRGRKRQTVSVGMRHATIEFLSERYASIEGVAPDDPWDAVAGAYERGDGRWVRLHPNFPHHRDSILRIL